MQNYYQKEIETASPEQIRAWQDERLVKTVHHVWDNVEFYRKRMEEAGVTPDDIQGVKDLHKLPFITKDDLRECYPYGLLAADLNDCVRIHSTSGTTGKRVVAFYTQNDIDLWEDCCARAIVAAGGTEEDVVQVCYGYGLFTGGAGLDGGSHKMGALTLPMSSGNTDRQLMFMTDLGATILCCTPSYASYLAECVVERGLRDQIKLKSGIFGAEAWTEEMRHDIEDKLGIRAYDIYGLTEISGPGVAFECSEQTGMHINEDHFIAEIINPVTGEVLPDGEKGKLQPEVDKFDPALALYGGPDGLDLVRRLISQTEGRLNAGAPIFLEIGSEQADVLKNEAINYPWLEFTGAHKDYCDNIRFVSYKAK